MNKITLEDRMKIYEHAYRNKLPPRMPVILRLDGVSFHSYLKGCEKPFDEKVMNAFVNTATYLCNHIQNAQVAYFQSDEISILLNNYKNLNTESWHGNNIQKMCSVAASMAGSYFSSQSEMIFGKPKLAHFDCPAFVLPKEEVNNYFVYRQIDCKRNSVQSMARSMYSHKQCNNKNVEQLKEMIAKEGQFHNSAACWEDLETHKQLGRCIIKEKIEISGTNLKTKEPFTIERAKWVVDNQIPEFSKQPHYINRFI